MDGAHSQIQGWTHLPPHPRPLILECPPPWGLTLHIMAFILPYNAQWTRLVGSTQPHHSAKSTCLTYNSTCPLCNSWKPLYWSVHNTGHCAHFTIQHIPLYTISTIAAWYLWELLGRRGLVSQGKQFLSGNFFLWNVWLKSSSGNVVQIKLFLYKWKALKCRYVKWFRLWMKSYDQKKLKIKFSNTPFSLAIGSSSPHGRKTFESLTFTFLFVITFSS